MKLTPEIVSLPAWHFVGLQTRFLSALSPETDNLTVLPRLWAEFSPRAPEVGTCEPGVFYGLCGCPGLRGETASRPHELIYLAGVRMAEPGAAPEGMTCWTSWAGTYAKFVHRGRIETIGETMGAIFGEWLPGGSYEHAGAADIERYGPEFDPTNDTSELEIYIPVRPAGAA